MSEELKEKYFAALEDVYDPELEVDVVNLGLIYSIDLQEDGIVDVTMTLTSMGCPAAPQIMEQVKKTLENFSEVNAVNVNLVWTPQWTKDKMTRYGKIALGIHE